MSFTIVLLVLMAAVSSAYISGILDIEFRDGKVRLESGEMFVVPKGVEHRPVARDECRLMLVEPKGVVNTGDAGGQLTAGNDVWV